MLPGVCESRRKSAVKHGSRESRRTKLTHNLTSPSFVFSSLLSSVSHFLLTFLLRTSSPFLLAVSRCSSFSRSPPLLILAITSPPLRSRSQLILSLYLSIIICTNIYITIFIHSHINSRVTRLRFTWSVVQLNEYGGHFT